MEARGFDQERSGLRDRIGTLLGAGDGYAAYLRRHRIKQWTAVSAVVLLAFAFAIGGYLLGASQVGDAETIQDSAFVNGQKQGTAAGIHEGYESAYEPARKQAYADAYDDAYVKSYREAFEKAGLSAPSDVQVTGP